MNTKMKPTLVQCNAIHPYLQLGGESVFETDRLPFTILNDSSECQLSFFSVPCLDRTVSFQNLSSSKSS